MFTLLSDRGTLKLVSQMPSLATPAMVDARRGPNRDRRPHEMKASFSTFQLILLTLFAGLIVVAKIALKLPLQLCRGTRGFSGWRSS